MRGALAIAAREVRELRMVFVGAAIIGVLPLAPFIWPAGPAGVHARAVGAAIFGAIVACGLASVVGTTILGRDLADRRLGFYFARPVSGFGIWAGKVAGGAAVVGAGLLLATLPGALAAGGAGRLSTEIFISSTWPNLGDAFIGLAVLYSLSIGAGIILRSRSGLAGIDLLACAAATFFSARILRWLVLSEVIEESHSAAEMAVAVLAAAVVVASAAAIAGGRVDRRRVHAIFSAVLWSLMAVAIAVTGGLVLWIRSASPASIETISYLAAAPRNGWIDIAGCTRNRFGYAANFLLDADSGRFLRLGAGQLGARNLSFSADGRRAAWWEPESGGQFSGAHLAMLDLTSRDSQARQTKISRQDLWARLVLDEDGSRVAVLGYDQISIYEIGSDRLLAAVRIPGRGLDIVRAFFQAPSTFRFVTHPWPEYGEPEKMLEVMDFDLTLRKLVRRASWPVLSKFPLVLVSPSQDRLLITGSMEQSLRLVDLDLGMELSRIPNDPGRRFSVRFLDDGRFAALGVAGGATTLRVFTVGGVELPAIPLGKSKVAILGDESAPGILIAALGNSSSEMHAVSIDVDRAQSHVLGDHLRPATFYEPVMTLDPSALPRAGSPATRLFETSTGGLVSIDPSTGTRKVILTGRGR
jgi:hypothetical protein